MKTELEQALEYWDSLSFDRKHELAVKYDNITKIEIWKKETQEYNETFNPDAHSHLIIDFDKVETIEEYLDREYPEQRYPEEYYCDLNQEVIKPHALKVAMSDAVKNYWYSQFLKDGKS